MDLFPVSNKVDRVRMRPLTVRFEMNAMFARSDRAVRYARTEHQGPRQSREARGDVDRARSCEIVDAEFIEPAIGIPLKVGKNVIDEGRPAEQEEHTRPQSTPFKHCAGQNHCSEQVSHMSPHSKDS
jgi:hypothetical protein